MNINLNPFSSFFLRSKNKLEAEREDQMQRNSQGVSHEEEVLIDAMQTAYSGGNNYGLAGNFNSTSTAFRSIFSSKAQKVATYKEMSYFPEVVDALSIICDEAITPDEYGHYVKLKILKEIPQREEKHIRKVFDYIYHDVLKFEQRGWELFRSWLIESELFLEKVLNDKGTKIVGIKVLPSINTYPIYEGNVIKKYIQTTKKVNKFRLDQSTIYETTFETDQICYLNYGQYGVNPLDVRGYLEPSIRTWNMLRNLEDAVVIYRITRAPERRLWNVEAGRIPPGKGEEYLRNLIARYKKDFNYDPTTGAVDSKKLFQALTHDFWFLKREGQGTDVQVLQSGMNLGEIEDVNYMLRKLYKTLNIPRSRWEDTMNSVATGMAPGEITREEVKFSRFVGRLRNRFKKIFIDLLTTQLRLSNQIDQKYTQEKIFDIEFCEENVFAEQKHLMNLKSRLEVASMMSQDIASKENPNGLWAKRFVMDKVFSMDDDQYQSLQNMIQEEIDEQAARDGDGGAPPGEDGADAGADAPGSKGAPPPMPTDTETPDNTIDFEGGAEVEKGAAPDETPEETKSPGEDLIKIP
jgi:hypothetical protein